jgi:23S rRNA (pseudouridine1915-N3)-methyltransferase
MILRIIAVGKLKEKHWQDGVADYAQRLRPYLRLELVEIPEVRIPEAASPAEEEIVKAQEAISILERLNNAGDLLIVLDRQGTALDSIELSKLIEKRILEGRSEMNWVIGGPLGLAPSLMKRADLILSFSRLTFPHQMIRVILLEQIYRSLRIIHHQPYHR